jgi:tetratricopeptide (TPR) repeat protein
MFDHTFSGRVSLWYDGSVPRLYAALCKGAKRAWALRSALLYLGLTVMIGYAFWEARTPVTMITPFQLSKGDLPFSGEIIADSVQDGLKSILNGIDEEKEDVSLRSSETGLPDLRNILIAQYWRVQAPPRFTVEVKGISYERILSLLRALMRTETTVSGDAIVEGDRFTLLARAGDAGPWASDPQPISLEGLRQASRDLATKIVEAEDPTLAGMALLRDEQVDQGLAAFGRALSLHPSDVRLKLNLCMAYGATRRYDQAIDCYKGALDMKPGSRNEVLERLAQVYYLKGDRDIAIDHYRELRKRGYRHALLGLGEAWDDTGHPADAVDVYDEFLATEREERNLAIAHLKRSAALAHLGRHKEALEEYGKALNYAPRDLLILVHESQELGEAVDVDAGIAQLQAVVDENKGSDSLPFAFLELGLLLEKKGDWQGAIDQFQAAVQLRRDYVEAHHKLAEALVHEGRVSDAYREYEMLATLSPDDLERGYSRMLAYQWLGNELRKQAHYSAAVDAYREAIHIKPENSAAHCQLAVILARQGHPLEAIRHYGAALVPAKLKQLNDAGCLADASHELDTIFAEQQRVLVTGATRNARPQSKTSAQTASSQHVLNKVPSGKLSSNSNRRHVLGESGQS